MKKNDIKNLKRRYLIWFYKTTKEALDKIERKFTQAEVDRFILKELKKTAGSGRLKKFISEFEAYVENKERQGKELKYEGKDLKGDYEFLAAKLKAIENAIKKELGKKYLQEIKLLYELEMTERILKSSEH